MAPVAKVKAAARRSQPEVAPATESSEAVGADEAPSSPVVRGRGRGRGRGGRGQGRGGRGHDDKLSEAEGPAAATAAPASAGNREELSVVPAGGQPVDVTPTTDVNAIYFSELDAARRCILQHPVFADIMSATPLQIDKNDAMDTSYKACSRNIALIGLPWCL